MTDFTSARFGAVTRDGDAGYVVREIVVNGRPTACSLYVAETLPDDAAAAALLDDSLDALDLRARAALRAELDAAPESGTVADFLQFHLDELTADALRGHATQPALLDALALVGISLHPAEPGTFEIGLDYCVGRAVSDQLLAVRFDPGGGLVSVSHES